jgi:DNA-binding MarR family transcriptional regulator
MNKSQAKSVADRLHSGAIHLLRRVRRQDEATGLTAARASALSVIVFGGPLPLGDLARAEQVSAPTMSRLIQGLVRDGLVQREVDPKDRRIVRLRATSKGARLLQQGRQRRVAALAEVLSSLSPRELTTLADATQILDRLFSHDHSGRSSISFVVKRRSGFEQT